MKGEELNANDLAASFQEAVIDVLCEKTIRAAKEYQAKQIIVAGGVAANKGLRAALTNEVNKVDGLRITFPSFKYCTDNAAMIGVAGYFQDKYQNN